MGNLNALRGVTWWHTNIRENDVRNFPLDGLQQVIAAFAHCHDVDVLDGREQLAQALPDQKVVLCQDDSDGHAERIYRLAGAIPPFGIVSSRLSPRESAIIPCPIWRKMLRTTDVLGRIASMTRRTSRRPEAQVAAEGRPDDKGLLHAVPAELGGMPTDLRKESIQSAVQSPRPPLTPRGSFSAQL